MDNICGICYRRTEDLFHLSNSPVATCRKCISNSVLTRPQNYPFNEAIKMTEGSQTTPTPEISDNIEQECPICGKYFARRYSFMNHVRNHSAERKHICQYCQKAFTQAANLRNHERIHTNERPFTCSVCQKAFTQVTNLNNHMRLHTGERPFQCPVEGCDKAFAQVTNLNNHAKTHQRDKSLKCDICHKSFFHYTDLNQHYRSHKLNTTNQVYQHMKLMNTPSAPMASNNICDMPGCLAVFDTTHELKRHIVKHTPKPELKMTINKHISCYFDSCNRKFATSEDLSSHLSQIHGLSLFNKNLENQEKMVANVNPNSAISYNLNNKNSTLKCVCCNKYFNSEDDLQRHMNEVKCRRKQETDVRC